MKVILRDDFGGEHELTEQVQMLYGHVVGSMDWGSGFLDTEEMLQVLEVGYLLGFEDDDLDSAITSAEEELNRLRKLAAGEAPGGYNRGYWARELPSKEQFLAGLEEIRERRRQHVAMTDDVTNFDE